MGNRSIYLNDDEEEWIDKNISNLSDYVRSRIREDIEINGIEKKINKNKQMISVFIYIIFAIIGITILVFSILLHVGGFRQTITLNYGTLIGLTAGIILEIIAIKYLVTTRIKDRTKMGWTEKKEKEIPIQRG
jgi:hypothetical protein